MNILGLYLTKNGTRRYVLIDIADYEMVEAAERLCHQLMQGRLSSETPYVKSFTIYPPFPRGGAVLLRAEIPNP